VLTRSARLRVWVLAATGLLGSLTSGFTQDQRSPASRQTVAFDAFVNWDFKHRDNLSGWRSTATVMQRTLEIWFPGTRVHSVVENGSPEQLHAFLRALPGERDCGLSVVYLASHQSPAGEWDFTQRRVVSWRQFLADSPSPAHPRRIIVTDACFAAALQNHSGWSRGFRGLNLFAALATERTFELSIRNRQPVDMRRRYPALHGWLHTQLGREWNGRLSFLGFVWGQAFLTFDHPPADAADWRQFFRHCERIAADFRQNANRRLSSTVTWSGPSEAGANR